LKETKMRVLKVIYHDQLGGDITRLDIHLDNGSVVGITGVGWPDAVFAFPSDPEVGEAEPDQSFFHDDFNR
jgi:hypothetical protein